MSKSKPLHSPASIWDLPENLIIKLKTWYAEKVSPRVMQERLAMEGFQVHHVRIFRFCRDHLTGIANPQGDPIFTPEDHVKLEQEVVTDLLKVCQSVLDDLEIPKIRDIDDLSKFVGAVARLQSSLVSRDRQELVRVGAEKKVVAQLKAEIQRCLAGRPDLVAELHEIIEKSSANMIDQGLIEL